MNFEPKRLVSAPVNRSAVPPVARAKALVAFCSIGVRNIPTGVSCSPRAVAPVVRATMASGITGLMPNYAFERSVKGCGWRAARVQRDFTLAARWYGLARPAQRGR